MTQNLAPYHIEYDEYGRTGQKTYSCTMEEAMILYAARSDWNRYPWGIV